MKRILFIIVLVLGCIAATAQTADDHLTFKGIPIDGTLNQFVSKLKTVGFSYNGMHEGTALLKGDFAGYSGCWVGVHTLGASDVVNSVAVIFPTMDDWSSLETMYIHIKSMLTKKYDEPSECIEEFQEQNGNLDNVDKLLSLMMDKCTYKTTFVTSKGIIQLSLGHVDGCYVTLRYFDGINTVAARASAIDDL